MQYKLTPGEKGKVEIKVDIPATVLDTAFAGILAESAKEANVAGFRPGMAPLDVVENHVGHSKILNKAASNLISKHLSEIFKTENIVPLDSPKIGIDSLSKGSPFSFTVSFVKKPQVKVPDWKEIKIAKVKAKEITEKDVSDSIKNIFEAWKKQGGTRNNKQGTDEGQITEGTEEVEGTEGQFSFAKATEGKGKFIYDAHGRKIFLEGTKDTKSNEDAKLDDEFAKAIGAKDLAHLRELVKKDLETLVANQVEAKLEEELFEKLAEMGTVEIPDILVDDELNRMIVRLNSELERQGKKIDEWLAEQKTTFVELRSKWRDQAAKNVKITLIMDEIGKEEKVQVTKEELEKSMANISSTKLSEEQKYDLENYMVMSIFQAKTLDLIKKAVSS